jgi:excisionase family DNA binding protein
MILTSLSEDSLKTLIAEVLKEQLLVLLPDTTPDVDESDKILEAPEVLELLKISPATLENWKRQGKIAFYRIGRRVYFKLSGINAALTKGKLPEKGRRDKLC